MRRLRVWSTAIALWALGVFAIIFGEADDSPGLQGIGLLLFAGGAAWIWRYLKKSR